MTTPDGAQLNLDALYKICPSCFTEAADANGKVKRAVDWKKLKKLLGDDAIEDDAPESYEFTWVGKRAAQREAAAPINKTLRPCPEESVDWENTQNLYIEGDNLEVLKLLQNSYMGKVKMIYIDPPYNTGSDLIYKDRRSLSEEDYIESISDGEGNKLVKNTYSNGAFHSDWCKMIYERLLVARTLLKEDGVIFISIDDNENKNLRNICDEVFGDSNYIAQVVWERAFSPVNLMKHFSPSHDYIVCYAKDIEKLECYGIPRTGAANDRYTNPDNDPRGPWTSGDLSVGPAIASNIYPIITPSGKRVMPPSGYSWRVSKEELEKRIKDNRIWFGEDGSNVPRIKRFLSELKKQGITPMTYWRHEDVGHSQSATQSLLKLFDGKKVFDYPKPIELIKRCISLYTKDNDIILDFFSGSATTAHSIFELNADDKQNRKFILVQLQEAVQEGTVAAKEGYKTICDIAIERIKRAGIQVSENIKSKIDTGFRVFKCDESNMKDVYFAPNDYSQGFLSMLEDNIKKDRSGLDLIFDCMLRWGVELSLPLSTKDVGDCTIYNVNDGDLVACFPSDGSEQAQGTITDEVIDAIAEMSPLRVVFRDSSFTEAAQKMNLFELFKQKCQWTDEEVKNNVKVI